MSKVVVINHVTLDGVMQSPGRAEEDTRDGFTHAAGRVRTRTIRWWRRRMRTTRGA